MAGWIGAIPLTTPLRADAPPPATVAALTAPKDVWEAICATPDRYSTLRRCIERSHLVDFFRNDPGSYTLFALDDTAFSQMPADKRLRLTEGADATAADAMLRSHTVRGRYSIQDLKALPGYLHLLTLDGHSLIVTRGDDGLRVNGVAITGSDENAGNSVIHSIPSLFRLRNAVFRPALLGDPKDTASAASDRPSIYETLLADLPDYHLLREAIERGWMEDAYRIGNRDFTLLAPDDRAFQAMLAERHIRQLSDMKREDLTKLVTSQTILGRYTLQDLNKLPDDTCLIGYNNRPVVINTRGGLRINGVPVVGGDYLARNGVIHRIGAVFPPDTSSSAPAIYRIVVRAASDGLPIQNAIVTIDDPSGRELRKTLPTDEGGVAATTPLEPGVYRIFVSAVGYLHTPEYDVALDAEVAPLEIKMKINPHIYIDPGPVRRPRPVPD